MKRTNFDTCLEEQLKDKAFAERFRQSGEALNAQVRVIPEPATPRKPSIVAEFRAKYADDEPTSIVFATSVNLVVDVLQLHFSVAPATEADSSSLV